MPCATQISNNFLCAQNSSAASAPVMKHGGTHWRHSSRHKFKTMQSAGKILITAFFSSSWTKEQQWIQTGVAQHWDTWQKSTGWSTLACSQKRWTFCTKCPWLYTHVTTHLLEQFHWECFAHTTWTTHLVNYISSDHWSKYSEENISSIITRWKLICGGDNTGCWFLFVCWNWADDVMLAQMSVSFVSRQIIRLLSKDPSLCSYLVYLNIKTKRDPKLQAIHFRTTLLQIGYTFLHLFLHVLESLIHVDMITCMVHHSLFNFFARYCTLEVSIYALYFNLTILNISTRIWEFIL
jgi:hypothetical protein